MKLNTVRGHTNVKVPLNKILIGTDPELLIVNNGKLVSENDSHNNYEFGLDGNGRIAELRVKPESDPIQLVNNIYDIFQRKIKRSPHFLNYNWHSGSFRMNECLGGHLHAGIRNFLPVVPYGSNNHPDYSDLVNIYDNYIGLISILIEDKEEGLKRRYAWDGEYGCAGNFRLQNFGVEYRVLSSFLSSPYVTAALFCLFQAITYEYLNNPNFIFRQDDTDNYINDMNTDGARNIFPNIWKDIVKMQLYQAYKPYIDLLYYLVRNKMTWFPRLNMKESWGLFDLTKRPMRNMNMDIIWARYANKKI